MVDLRDRINAVELQLRSSVEIDLPRHSTDHRFDRSANATGEKEDRQLSSSPAKSKFYDSIGASFGLDSLDVENFAEYTVYNAYLTNLRVCPVDLNGSFYYIEHRSFILYGAPNTPGVMLHEGHDKEGRCLGVAHMPFTSGHNMVGIGDFTNDPNAVVWEKLDKGTFWTHMRYEFEYAMPNGERKKFEWMRTRNMILDDQGDLVLIEEGKNDVILAEYLGKGLLKWKKRGRLRLQVVEGFGDSWKVMVLVTWAAVVELSRRRARNRRFSGVKGFV